MANPIIFIGTRVSLPEMAVAAEAQGHEILGILDHQYWGHVPDFYGIPVIGDERWLLDPKNKEAQSWRYYCAFHTSTFYAGQQNNSNDGSNGEMLRWQRIQMATQLGLDMATLIHPDARVTGLNSRYSNVTIGAGTYIHPGALLNLHDIKIGNHCSIGANTMISHGGHIGNNVLIGPSCHIYDIEVHDNSYIGMNCTVDVYSSAKNPITIGQWSTVWGHTLIKTSVPENHMLTPQGRCWRKYRSLDWAQTSEVCA